MIVVKKKKVFRNEVHMAELRAFGNSSCTTQVPSWSAMIIYKVETRTFYYLLNY